MPIKPPSFETIENLGKKAGQTMGAVATVVSQDIAEQFGLKEVSTAKKEEIKKDDKRKIDYLTNQISQVRQQKVQKQTEVKHVEKQYKFFDKKKKQDALRLAINAQKGSKEQASRTGG